MTTVKRFSGQFDRVLKVGRQQHRPLAKTKTPNDLFGGKKKDFGESVREATGSSTNPQRNFIYKSARRRRYGR